MRYALLAALLLFACVPAFGAVPTPEQFLSVPVVHADFVRSVKHRRHCKRVHGRLKCWRETVRR